MRREEVKEERRKEEEVKVKKGENYGSKNDS